MKGQRIQEVSVGQSNPLTWPEEADIICMFATVEGFMSFRKTTGRSTGSWLIQNLCKQIHIWLNDYERTKDTDHVKDLEFHHLLIRVNAAIGGFQNYFLLALDPLKISA